MHDMTYQCRFSPYVFGKLVNESVGLFHIHVYMMFPLSLSLSQWTSYYGLDIT